MARKGSALDQLSCRNIRTNGDVLLRLSVRTQEGDDSGPHPVMVASPGPVADLAMPDFAVCHGFIHRLEEAVGMLAGIQERMILTKQLFA